MCHFPTACVTYPASDSSCGSVISPLSPPGMPYIGGTSRPCRIGSRPVMMDALVGVHEGSL